MTKYAIPACEQDGLHMRGFCFFINAKDGMTPDDVLEARKMNEICLSRHFAYSFD